MYCPGCNEPGCAGCLGWSHRTGPNWIWEHEDDPGLKKPTLHLNEGRKDDKQKIRWDLFTFSAADEVVKVLTYGAEKYGDENWRKVPDLQRRYMGAALRHLSAYNQGQENDQESGLSHLAHAICSLMFILEDKLKGDKDEK